MDMNDVSTEGLYDNIGIWSMVCHAGRLKWPIGMISRIDRQCTKAFATHLKSRRAKGRVKLLN